MRVSAAALILMLLPAAAPALAAAQCVEPMGYPVRINDFLIEVRIKPDCTHLLTVVAPVTAANAVLGRTSEAPVPKARGVMLGFGQMSPRVGTGAQATAPLCVEPMGFVVIRQSFLEVRVKDACQLFMTAVPAVAKAPSQVSILLPDDEYWQARGEPAPAKRPATVRAKSGAPGPCDNVGGCSGKPPTSTQTPQ